MTAAAPVTTSLAERATILRSLHIPGRPLVLVNAWDAASARRIQAAGAPAIATSSAAVAQALGEADGDAMDPVVAFAAVARIARSVDLPVTADIEAGYGLDGAAIADALLGAGAVGANLEDSDHRRPGELQPADLVAGRIAAVRSAGLAAGVELVINARIDTILHGEGRDPVEVFADTVARAHTYLDAGAACVYPIRMTDPEQVRRLVAELDAPVNANVGAGGSVAALADAGAARVSFGPMPFSRAMDALDDLARGLLSGR